MQGKLTRDRHERLMTRMADTLGADLETAEAQGQLPPEMREDMLLACTGCADPTACRHWLETHDTADAAPGYCRNRDILHNLAAE
jgi:hypothetical protein